jgi:hypothetical protein
MKVTKPKVSKPGVPEFVVTILHADMSYLRKAIALEQGEIGGAAHVRYGEHDLQPGEFRIERPEILDQEVTGASVDMDTSFPEWLKTTFPGEFAKPLPQKCMTFAGWHSHGTMSSYFSTIDDEWIGNFVTNGWFVSVVGNRKDEWMARVDTRLNGMQATFEAKLHIIHEGNAANEASAIAHHKARVKQADDMADYYNGYDPSGNWKGHKGIGNNHVVLPFQSSAAISTTNPALMQLKKSKHPALYFTGSGAISLYDCGILIRSFNTSDSLIKGIAQVMNGLGYKRIQENVGSRNIIVGVKKNNRWAWEDRSPSSGVPTPS